MKKTLSLILALILTVSLLAGCGGTPSATASAGAATASGAAPAPATKVPEGSNITLDVSVFAQEHEQVMYKEVIKKFEEKFNVTVNFQVAGDQYWPELEAALTANTAPDVFYLGLGDIKKRVWADKIVALDTLLDTAALNKIWPDALNLYKYDLGKR